jgi:glycosyltransferase involved in cell wall biosynthesis
MPGVRVRAIEWRSASEAADLAPVQIGLMPVPDDAWALGKCACKALQYMALGIPTVVSPVGVNATLVRDGVNGLHASTREEWVAQLARLVADRSLRARLGEEGRRTVEAEYSARVQAPRLLGLLESLARRRVNPTT